MIRESKWLMVRSAAHCRALLPRAKRLLLSLRCQHVGLRCTALRWVSAGSVLAAVGVTSVLSLGQERRAELSLIEARERLVARVPGIEIVYVRENEATRRRSDEAAQDFLNHQYGSAASKFADASRMAASPGGQAVLSNLVTASLFGAGAHRRGLRYICERYRYQPASSHRYRHDIHAHLRRIALDEGHGSALSFLDQLRRDPECRRADFSPIWIAVPFEIMWPLLQSIPRPIDPRKRTRLDADDVALLQTQIRQGAAFADYGLYVLGDFDGIIYSSDFSYIRDMAIFAAARAAMPTSGSDGDPRTATNLLNLYVSEYPTGPSVMNVLGMLRVRPETL